MLALSVPLLGAAPATRPLKGGTLVAVENLGGGRIQVKRSHRTLAVDLAQEVAGCTGQLYDPTVEEKSDSDVTFEIVDEAERAPYTYVLLLASAPPNCNVQGMCGAAESASTLIWLKLTKDLALAGKQAVVLIDCRSDRYAKIPRGDDSDPDAFELLAKDLPWSGDSLQIDFDPTAESPVRRWIYDRKKPEAGLQAVP
jgi:hypothetical protein